MTTTIIQTIITITQMTMVPIMRHRLLTIMQATAIHRAHMLTLQVNIMDTSILSMIKQTSLRTLSIWNSL